MVFVFFPKRSIIFFPDILLKNQINFSSLFERFFKMPRKILDFLTGWHFGEAHLFQHLSGDSLNGHSNILLKDLAIFE